MTDNPYFPQYVLPVKHAAAHTLCVFLRHNRRQDQRHDMITWMIEGLEQYGMLIQ